MKNRETEELINIGKIGSSVGLRGEVRVTLYAQDSGNLKEGKVLLLKHAGKKTASDEEAGTKLLGPLFIMLVIVMVMIIVPALLSF